MFSKQALSQVEFLLFQEQVCPRNIVMWLLNSSPIFVVAEHHFSSAYSARNIDLPKDRCTSPMLRWTDIVALHQFAGQWPPDIGFEKLIEIVRLIVVHRELHHLRLYEWWWRWLNFDRFYHRTILIVQSLPCIGVLLKIHLWGVVVATLVAALLGNPKRPTLMKASFQRADLFVFTDFVGDLFLSCAVLFTDAKYFFNAYS